MVYTHFSNNLIYGIYAISKSELLYFAHHCIPFPVSVASFCHILLCPVFLCAEFMIKTRPPSLYFAAVSYTKLRVSSYTMHAIAPVFVMNNARYLYIFRYLFSGKTGITYLFKPSKYVDSYKQRPALGTYMPQIMVR